MDFLDKVTYAQLGFLPVINYMIHYSEEGAILLDWVEKNMPDTKFKYTQKKLNLENILYFGFALIGAVLLSMYPNVLLFQAMVLSVACAFISNTWFHAKPTLITKIYSPGVVSACLFNQVVCLLLLMKAESIGLLNVPFIVVTALLMLAVFPLCLHLTHNVLLKDDDQKWPWLENFPIPRHVQK